ncbi:hypothetical protein DY000_02040239 [Brassica cretica]|uniref:Uncharacterized protein n=1 Tax=Brassica cretica TaxID=69181 RepID=A0ABQ7BIA5_BRACR|nr:hypothetical protein DY000_02040239 [Brassica cretica]
MAATKMFFRSGFGYAGFLDLEDVWDDLPVSRLKYNVLDDFQEVVWTSWKSSDGVFSHVPPFHNRSERFGFSDLKDFWDDLHTTFRRSSGLPGSRLMESSPMSLPFITDLSVLVFNQMALIFHSFKGFSDLKDFWDDLHVSHLKYNAIGFKQ